MPKNLTNRLDKLETELLSLLQLQEVAKSCRSTAASQHTAAEVSPRRNHFSSSEKDKCAARKMTRDYSPRHPSPLSCTKHKEGKERHDAILCSPCCSPPSTPRSPIKRSKCTKVKRPDQELTDYCPPDGGFNVSKYCNYKDNGRGNVSPGRNLPNHKPLNPTNPLGDFVESKLNAMQKEIQEERHGRWKAEQSVAQLRDVMENNKAAIQEMIQSKRLALEMAKQLREKYTVVREARTQALAQLDALKEENGCLLAKLAQEKQERSKLLDQMTVRHVETERIHQKKREQLTEEIQKLSEDNGSMKEKVIYLQDRVAEAEKRLIDRQEEIAQEMDKRLTLSILESEARFRVEQRSLQDELEKKTKQYEDMESRCHSLERKLKKAQDEDNEKYEEAEKEFHKMKLAMKDKDDLIEREREELRHLVQDLTDMVKQHKARIVELTEINKQQEIVLKSQSQSIDSKEEQMEMSYREVEVLQRKCMELEDQASVLKKNLEELQTMKQESDSIFEEKASKERRSFEERQAVLERDVQECRRSLEAEKDKLLIKDKIIDDQTGTIKQLKSAVQDKSEEVRKVIRDKEQVERELNQEKQYRLKLAGEVSKVRWRKEQLKQKVSDLEDDLRSTESMDTSEMVKQQERLAGLEKQVESKQKEWELQLKLLTKEKEQAVNAAKFATQKLLETVTEFQKQVASNKKVQQSLAKLLSEKDAQLIAATEKIMVLNIELKNSSRQAFITKQNIECKLSHARDVCADAIHEISSQTKFI